MRYYIINIIKDFQTDEDRILFGVVEKIAADEEYNGCDKEVPDKDGGA